MTDRTAMFVSVLDLTGEVELTILKGEGEVIARAPIGYDPAVDVVYSVVVALSLLAGHADIPGYELVFTIVEASLDGTETRVYWDGSQTRALLGERALRTQVRSVILKAIEVLIDEASPNLVSMTTHEPGLPAAALSKYAEICALSGHNGFTAGKADGWHDHHIWMMTR